MKAAPADGAGDAPCAPRPTPLPDEPDRLDPDLAAVALAGFMAGAVAQMRETCAAEVERWAELLGEPDMTPEARQAAHRIGADLAGALRSISAAVDPWGSFELLAALKRLPSIAASSPAEAARVSAGLRFAVMNAASRVVEGEVTEAARELRMRRWVSLAAYALEGARLTGCSDASICADLADTLSDRAARRRNAGA